MPPPRWLRPCYTGVNKQMFKEHHRYQRTHKDARCFGLICPNYRSPVSITLHVGFADGFFSACYSSRQPLDLLSQHELITLCPFGLQETSRRRASTRSTCASLWVCTLQLNEWRVKLGIGMIYRSRPQVEFKWSFSFFISAIQGARMWRTTILWSCNWWWL